MAGINIPLLADVRAFLRGTRQAAEAIDDVGDSLSDLDGPARTSTRDVERNLDNAADTAEDSAQRIERSFKDALDSLPSASRKAGDDLGDDITRGTDRAVEGVDDFKQEAAGSAREAAASFSGSADDIAGTFQEVAANALGGFGPLGAAAGLALAVGFGTFYEKFKADAEAAETRVNDMADAMIEANSRVLAEDYINDQLRRIYTNADDAAIKVAELREASEETGVSEAELARAFSGDQDSRVAALARVRAALADANRDAVSLDVEVAASGVTRQVELGKWADKLGGLGEDYTSAAGRAEGYAAAVAAAHGQADREVGQTRAEYEALHREVDAVPKTVDTKVTVTGTKEATEALDAVVKPRTVTLQAWIDTQKLDRDLRNWHPPMIAVPTRTGVFGP